MAAPDFFENFLLHDGVKALHPNENLSIVSLVSSETTRQADTLRIEVPAFYPWGRGGLTASPPVGACVAPATVRPTLLDRAAPCPETARSMRRI